MAAGALQLRIMRTAGAFAEITWAEPTTTVGVQFWGDANEGKEGTGVRKHQA